MQGSDGWLAIPVPSYLIIHPKVKIIFDAGLEERLQTDSLAAQRQVLGALSEFVRPRIRPGGERC